MFNWMCKVGINCRFRISEGPQSNYLVNAHLFSNKKLMISIKQSCKDDRQIIATNCHLISGLLRHCLLFKESLKKSQVKFLS